MDVHLAAVTNDYRPWMNGFHVARVTVTFRDVSGEQQVSPADEFSLRDALGVWQQTGFWLGGAPAGCLDPENARIMETLAPGGTAGPFNICFEAGGSVSAPLLLAWEPNALTNGGTNEPNCTQENVPANYVPPTDGVLFTSNVHGCATVLLAVP
jgi:hypothetical protein